MAMDVICDANGFVVLDRRGCLERLAQHRVAAVAITDSALPIVLPALYLLSGEDILVGVAATGILGRRMPNNVVSLCVYELDDDLSSGWTVTVTGLAESVSSVAEPSVADALRQWGGGDSKQIVVRIGTERISGRQLPLKSSTARVVNARGAGAPLVGSE
jgi:Pyridoxamine 5'-phosphate oxidase